MVSFAMLSPPRPVARTGRYCRAHGRRMSGLPLEGPVLARMQYRYRAIVCRVRGEHGTAVYAPHARLPDTRITLMAGRFRRERVNPSVLACLRGPGKVASLIEPLRLRRRARVPIPRCIELCHFHISIKSLCVDRVLIEPSVVHCYLPPTRAHGRRVLKKSIGTRAMRYAGSHGPGAC